jgi:hypothetical protein
MNTRKKKKWVTHGGEGAASGAVAGTVVGAAAGPPGMLAGAVMGAVAGALADVVLDAEAQAQSARTHALDAEIGVSEGNIGAANLEHPPGTVGAYSAASAGMNLSADQVSSDGPIQRPPD